MELLFLHQGVTHRSDFKVGILFIIFLTTSKSFGYIPLSDYNSSEVQIFDSDVELYNQHKQAVKHVFDYRNNGIKLDIKVVPAVNDSISEKDDKFPKIPLKDFGRCILLHFSFSCLKERISRYIDTIGKLNEIILRGDTIKLVKVRSIPRRKIGSRLLSTTSKIDRSVDDFFDQFALRITIPPTNGKKEQSQIDLMFDDSQVEEGRGKGGGGGGGKGGKGCKQMMMCMMMALKMKMIGMMGLMAMKGMVWTGMTMMLAKGMLVMKMMSMKGGPWAGGGGGGGGGGKAPLKEIVLLTKATDGGGGGGGGYSAPPPPPPPPPLPIPSSSYGAPSHGGGGGGGYDYSGGGGGWGRSFDNRLPMTSQTNKYSHPSNTQQIADKYSSTYVHLEDQLNTNNNWESKDYYDTDEQVDEEHIGEATHINEPKQTEKELSTERQARVDLDVNNYREESDMIKKVNFDESKLTYAKYWKNYEAADRIWNSKGPIVVKKLPDKKK